MKNKKGMFFLKIFFNFFWVLSFIFTLVFLFLILPGKLKVWINQDDYQVGMFEVERKYATGHSYKGSSSGLIGKIDNKKKRVSFNYHKGTGIKSDDYQEGSQYQVWYHKDLKSAFLKFENSEKFELPNPFIDQIYSAVYILIFPFLILSGIKIYLRRTKKL